MSAADRIAWNYPYPLAEVPPWCGMPEEEHEDGAGGCWALAYGYVQRDGERSCQGCEFHKTRPPERTP